MQRGKAMIFGRGVNPINFVSVDDVARFALIGLEHPQARGETLEIGGPENLSLTQVIAIIERVTGRVASKQRIPLPMMRAMALLARPINPAFARQVATGVVMDTQDMTFDPAPTLAHYPGNLRRLEDVARELFAAPVPA
jgi:NADH dehydrogenase